MNRRRLLPLLLLLLPARLLAQDAHSMAIGGAATAAPMGIFSMIWNPSQLALPDTSSWTVASGYSAFDTSNSGVAIFHFTPQDALGASQDPIQRFQQYQGLFAVKYTSAAGGVLYDQELNYLASQGALQFFNDRNAGPIPLNASYNLNFQQTTQQVATLLISYAMQLPIGTIPFFSVGGNLKYHDGLQYGQTSLTGTYTQGVTTGYTYTKTTSNSGSGLSMDLGFFAKMTDAIQIGLMLQNIQSNFTWQAQQQNYTLDPNTGAETPVPGSATNVTVSTPYPYARTLGLSLAPPNNNIVLEGEVSWSQQLTHWKVGLDRYYPEANLDVRLGTFTDDVSNQQLWTFGVGYLTKTVTVDLAFLTRSIPNLQDSIALGGALDAGVRF
jgi:hypothetical protein